MTSSNQARTGNPGWKIVLKVLITGGVGGVAYLVTNLAHQPQVWALTMSIFIGGVALVVQFLSDFETRLVVVDERHARQLAQMREIVDRRFADVSEATELFGQLEAATLRTDTVVSLVQYATRIDLAKNSLLTKLVQSELTAMSEFVRQVVDNLRTEYPGGEKDWLFTLVQNAEDTVKATSTIGPEGQALVDEGFWTSQDARTYLDLQRDAVQRGVKVQRIFILFSKELADDPSLRSIIQDNVEAGVDVKVLPPEAQRSEGRDFVLFDDRISYELLSVSLLERRSKVESTTLELRSQILRRRQEQFARLWSAAEPPRGGSSVPAKAEKLVEPSPEGPGRRRRRSGLRVPWPRRR